MAEGRIVPDGAIVAYQNDINATIATNIVVMRDSTVTDGIKLPTGVTVSCVGVTMRAIEDGTYGPVQRSGRAYCTAADAITAGADLMTDTAGKVLTWSASADDNAFFIGTAVGAAGADGDTILVDLNLHFKQG
jgi:hypothetical protein